MEVIADLHDTELASAVVPNLVGFTDESVVGGVHVLDSRILDQRGLPDFFRQFDEHRLSLVDAGSSPVLEHLQLLIDAVDAAVFTHDDQFHDAARDVVLALLVVCLFLLKNPLLATMLIGFSKSVKLPSLFL